MTKVQQITIRTVGGTESLEKVAHPGNPQMWKVLQQALGPIECLRSLALIIEWDEKAKLPSAAQWQSWLSFSGLHRVSLRDDTVERTTLQVRRRGPDADSLVSLAREWMRRQNFPDFKNVWLARQYEFHPQAAAEGKDAPPGIEALEETLRKIIFLGPRSGVFHPEIEEARVLVRGESLAWPMSSAQLKTPEDHLQAFQEALTLGRWGPLRRHYRVGEFKPRAKQPFTEDTHNPLTKVFRSGAHAAEAVPTRPASAPVSFIVSLPRTPDAYNSLDRFRHRCEILASQYDRSLGLITMREPSNAAMIFDVWSSLPLNNRPLGTPPSNEHKLYMLGPWDSRNAIIERRIECWARICDREGQLLGEIVDGSQDWVAHMAQALSSLPSWNTDKVGGRQLIQQNLDRTRCQRLWFFWYDKDPRPLAGVAKGLGVELACLGQRGSDGKFHLPLEGKDFPLEMKSLSVHSASRDRVKEVAWMYPDVKTPTYGFERAALFPDEYLLKVTHRDENELEWSREAKLFYSGDRLRSAMLRNSQCTPLSGFRWTDGTGLWAEATGRRMGWLEVDPRAAGLAAIDAAVRSLVALGARPQGGTAQLWMSQPEESENLEESNARWAAYVLALEGAAHAAKSFNFKLDFTNGGGISYPGHAQEMFVKLRARLPDDCPTTMPGFRMAGEVLYALGPRPAFVDAGSRILPYVKRIISNHITKIFPEVQLELYELVHRLLKEGVITCIQPIGEGGIAAAVGEMALWGEVGAQLRPNIPTIELFSGSPGRFLIGILPQEAKRFESMIKSELVTHLGSTGGEKVLGLPLIKLSESREILK